MRPSTNRITMSHYPGQRGISCHFNVNDHKLLGDEIVFDIKNLIIKRPHIDSKKTYSLKTGAFTFSLREGNFEDYVGVYKLIMKDEDTFKLKKLKQHVQKFN